MELSLSGAIELAFRAANCLFVSDLGGTKLRHSHRNTAATP